jgi:hypothetical protein
MVPRHSATSQGSPLSRTVLIRLRISSTVGNLFKGGASIKHVPDIQRGDGVRVIGQRFADL